MNPSPAAITAIQAYGAGLSGGWSANTNAQIETATNAPSIANPTPQATVPKPYTFTDLMAVLSQPTVATLIANPNFSTAIAEFNAGNTPAVELWIAGYEKSGTFTSTDVTNLQTVMTATELDPSWQPQISWAQANLGRPADSDDIAKARP